MIKLQKETEAAILAWIRSQNEIIGQPEIIWMSRL